MTSKKYVILLCILLLCIVVVGSLAWNLSSLEIDFTDLLRAQRAIPFRLSVPTYMAQGFEYSSLSVIEPPPGLPNQVHEVIVNYSNRASQDSTETDILIRIRNLPQETVVDYDYNSKMEVEEVEGTLYYLLNSKMLAFSAKGVYYEIYGPKDAADNELIKIAQSF